LRLNPEASPELADCTVGVLPRARGESVGYLLSLHLEKSKENNMDVAARLSSKGQVTIPKAVRDALGVEEGDSVIFRIDGNLATLQRTPDFLELAGTLAAPATKKSASWDRVLEISRASRAKKFQ
jgi:AbrB family looped-hinge helix DNA binding protein